jgi:hypothetical protein
MLNHCFFFNSRAFLSNIVLLRSSRYKTDISHWECWKWGGRDLNTFSWSSLALFLSHTWPTPTGKNSLCNISWEPQLSLEQFKMQCSRWKTETIATLLTTSIEHLLSRLKESGLAYLMPQNTLHFRPSNVHQGYITCHFKEAPFNRVAISVLCLDTLKYFALILSITRKMSVIS